jgi:hypothetical protein
MLEGCFAYVVADVEGRVEFPAGQPNIEERRHNPLQVPWNQRELGLHKLHAAFERDFAIKHADTSHVERHALAFEVEENRISPRKAVTLLLVLHGYSPIC